VLHFTIIQCTICTPHDYKICDAFLSREIYSGEFELFTKPSKSDFYEFIKLDGIGIFIRMLCNLSISFGVLNNHIDLPIDNKMEPVLSELPSHALQ